MANRRWSIRHVIAAFGLGVIVSGVTVAQAASLGGSTASPAGTTATVVAGCDPDGINVTWEDGATSPVFSGSPTVANSTYNVVTIKLTGVNVACNGQNYKFVVANSSGTLMTSGSGTLAVAAGTVTWTITAQNAKTVGQLIVSIYN